MLYTLNEASAHEFNHSKSSQPKSKPKSSTSTDSSSSDESFFSSISKTLSNFSTVDILKQSDDLIRSSSFSKRYNKNYSHKIF